MKTGLPAVVLLPLFGMAGFYVFACARPVHYLQAPLERPKGDAGKGDGLASSDAGSRGDTPARAEGRRSPATFAGRWTGTGTQGDGQRWLLVVNFKPTVTGLCATAEYPGVGCASEWYCRGMEDDQVVATERLTRGKDKCIDGGEMRMDFQGDTLEWSWRKDGETADAIMKRTP